MISIQLTNCRIDYQPREWVSTVFPDGTEYGAFPHDTPHYHVIAHRCGYGDDLWSYCFEHEFCHSFIAEAMGLHHSGIVYCLAHGNAPSVSLATAEEAMVQTFQRWLRANERPIIGGVDWDALKNHALALLTSASARAAPVEPIPSGVRYDPAVCRFRESATGKDMGYDFYKRWQVRASQFPGWQAEAVRNPAGEREIQPGMPGFNAGDKREGS